MENNNKIVLLIVGATLMSGCAATGQELKGNVYKAGQVNTAQAARTIKITAILPAQIEVDNSKQKRQAQVGGAVLGAVAGGLAGRFAGDFGAAGTAGTAVGGGVVGGLAGSAVSDKVLVDGVSIAYIENAQMLTSAQVGKQCEFKLGTALIISTGGNETRIQPNNTCPVEN